MKILLDTSTFLWITLNDSRLSATARQVFADPANEVFLSAVSVWEITIKYTAGRLPLPAHPELFIPRMRRGHDIRILALSERAALRERQLPRHHKDPFDRMLVCQALVHHLTILTPDPLIRQYPAPTAW